MSALREDLQYDAWGVIVQTSRVRAGHVANGLVQLLRLLPTPPRMSTVEGSSGRVRTYNQDIITALRERFEAQWQLTEEGRRICIAATDAGDGDPRLHERRALLAGALNADGLVMRAGGNDPTTPGLSFAGYTSTHTLKGMHAATFLGLLSHSSAGIDALKGLHELMASAVDPHSDLVRRLKLGLPHTWTTTPTPDQLRNAYPLPSGLTWTTLAEQTGTMASNLLAWSAQGMSKATTLMALTDLAALLLFLRLVRWTPPGDAAPAPLLLVVSPFEVDAAHFTVIARAQQNLKSALARLDQLGHEHGLVIQNTSPRTRKTTVYWPGVHAQNLGAASGWLYPLDSRGGAKRYFRPGPRQLTTLVHSLLAPGEEISWPEFASRAQHLGLVLGGPRESTIAAQLRLSGGAFSIREAGRINRHHLVALGLARQESDNVVRVDGGLK
jgi:hypothetical protein